MNPNQTRALWISIGAGLFAMFLIYSYSQEKKAEYDRRYGATKRVLIAATDILEMSTIDDTMLQVEERPVDFIQPSALEDPEDVVGLVAAAPMKKGEQILATKLLAPGPNTGLSLQVAPKRRALTIPIDDVRGVARLIRPGDRVDLITAVTSGAGPTKKTEVSTVLQNVPVLATGVHVTNHIPRVLEVDRDGKKAHFRNLRGDLTFTNMTIEVTPSQAQDLIYIMATSPGSLFATLRNPNDTSPVRLGVTSKENVLRSPSSGGRR